MSRYYGFNPPFVGGSQGVMSRQEGDRLISNDILHNLLITPGELPFMPDFGVNLRDFVFEQFDDSRLEILKSDISRQLVANDPRLVVKTIRLTPQPDDMRLDVYVVVGLIDEPDRTIEIKRLIKTLNR